MAQAEIASPGATWKEIFHAIRAKTAIRAYLAIFLSLLKAAKAQPVTNNQTDI